MDKESDFPKVTQEVNGRTRTIRMHSQGSLPLAHFSLLIPYSIYCKVT